MLTIVYTETGYEKAAGMASSHCLSVAYDSKFWGCNRTSASGTCATGVGAEGSAAVSSGIEQPPSIVGNNSRPDNTEDPRASDALLMAYYCLYIA